MMSIPEAARTGVVSAVAFSAALAVAALLADGESFPPIVPALAASLLLAAVEWKPGAKSPHADVEPTRDTFVSWLVAFVVATIILTVLTHLLPRGSQFVCEPLVPWRLSIAVFGAFLSSWLAAGMSTRSAELSRQPLIRLILFWIAPFYGFFHAPWFLAQSLAIPCTERPLAQAVIAAVAMMIAALGGARVGAWMFGRRA